MHLVNYLEQCKKLLVVNYFEIKIKEIIPFSYKNSLSNNRDEDPESIILVRQNVISSVSEAIFNVFFLNKISYKSGQDTKLASDRHEEDQQHSAYGPVIL